MSVIRVLLIIALFGVIITNVFYSYRAIRLLKEVEMERSSNIVYQDIKTDTSSIMALD